jgi:hypothetical protein
LPASGMAAVSRAALATCRGLARRPGAAPPDKQRTTTRKFLFRPLRVNSKQGQYKDREQREQRRTTDRTPTARRHDCVSVRCVGRAKPSEATRVSDSQRTRFSEQQHTRYAHNSTQNRRYSSHNTSGSNSDSTGCLIILQARQSYPVGRLPILCGVGWLIIGRRAPTEERRCCQRRLTRAALLPGTGGRTR